MRTRDISLGPKKAVGFEINLPGAPLLLARGEKGYVMCGYLDMAVADKFGQAAAVVRGIKTLDELLESPVADVSVQAKRRGVKPGMTGRQALQKLA
ncbi:MAG: YunC family protein [Elusimicrobiota bacterium]